MVLGWINMITVCLMAYLSIWQTLVFKALVLTSSIANFFTLQKKIMAKFNPLGVSYKISSTTGKKIKIGPQFWPDLVRYNLPKLIKNFSCPILFIHGEKDTKVPLK